MKTKLIQNLHLYISIPVVMLVAFVYGFQPDLLFNVQPTSIDEHNVYKAIMGIYLAFTSFWCLALVKNQYWRADTLSNMIFMLGLALGRLLSFFADGMPSLFLFFGGLGELTLACYAAYILKKAS